MIMMHKTYYWIRDQRHPSGVDAVQRAKKDRKAGEMDLLYDSRRITIVVQDIYFNRKNIEDSTKATMLTQP